MMIMRSKLFLRGDRTGELAQALATGADVVSVDLEDTVVPAKKRVARAAVREAVRGLAPGLLPRILVRVNSVQSGLLHEDLSALVGTGVTLLNLPKPEAASHVREACEVLTRLEATAGLQQFTCKLLLNVESPAGLRCIHEISGASARVAGLQIGYADLLEPYGIDREFATAVDHIRMTVRMAAAEFNLPVYDGVYAGVNDSDFFRAECIRARRMGFAGKSCFDAQQVRIANEVFQPTPEQVRQAERIVESAKQAFANGDGIYMLDGRMVDEPFVNGARNLLERARRMSAL